MKRVRIISAPSIFAGLMLLPVLSIAMQGQHPAEGKLLYCKYVLFVWDQNPQASSYQLQVAIDEGDLPFEDNLVVDHLDPTNAAIIKSGIDFSNSYVWRARPMSDNEDVFDWSGIHRFSLVELPDSTRNAFTPDIYEPEQMQPGINLCTPYGITCGLENDGEVIWYLSGEPIWWYGGQWDVRQEKNGNFYALHNGGIRFFNVDNDTIWFGYDQLNEITHHEIYRKNDDNLITLVRSFKWISKDGDSTRWMGDDIVELNEEKEVVWRWSCFDHISTEDFDSSIFATVPPGGLFDWTHSNACPLDANEEAIYLSVRNLSRIIKIAYPSGDIIWSMGQNAPSGDVDFGDNIGFFRQHSTYPLEDGRLLFFDNHWVRYSDWSRALIVEVDTSRELPAQIVWEFRTEFSTDMGSARTLPNNNILICTGRSNSFYEVKPDTEVVWEVHLNLRERSYRVKRIPSLYPLVFTVNTPPDSGEMPVHQTYVRFRINNEGELAQSFSYHVRDSNGWLEQESGLVEIQPGQSVYIVALGYAPPVDHWDEITFTVEPVVAPDMAEVYTVRLRPGPAEASPEELLFLPGKFELLSNYPNPFNTTTCINFNLPTPGRAELLITDLQGRTVKTLFLDGLPAGLNQILWNARDDYGNPVTSGCYNYLIKYQDKRISGKMSLMK